MSDPIKNRYDFVVYFDVENGSPNGDPDAGNMPRIDPETGYGIVTDVCLKRKIRNYVETVKEDDPGFDIYVKDGSILNVNDARAFEALGIDAKDIKKLKKDDPELDEKIRDFMCATFYDVRTFGAVMTTFVKNSLNCGQVRGPVQLTFARSVDPIIPQEVTITRVAITTEADSEKKGTEMGRKYVVPYALYRGEGYVSANLARKLTGFSDEDLSLLWEAIVNMFEHDHSAARGKMAVRALVAFKHDSELGNAPSYKLFDAVSTKRKAGVEAPRSIGDYEDIAIDESAVPEGHDPEDGAGGVRRGRVPLALSGIQHFSFCRRQWALIHIEQAWADNVLTAEGELMHKRAHDEELRERRGDNLVVRSQLGALAGARTVEGNAASSSFAKARTPSSLGRMACGLPCPWSTSTDPGKANDADRLQLCAQALCLEGCSGAKRADRVPLLRRDAFARNGGARRIVARFGRFDGRRDARPVPATAHPAREAFFGMPVMLAVRFVPAARDQSDDVCGLRGETAVRGGAMSIAQHALRVHGGCVPRARRGERGCPLRWCGAWTGAVAHARVHPLLLVPGSNPALMGACAGRGVGLSFFDRRGRFLAGVHGGQRGNVLLRKTQYAWSESDEKSLAVARNFIVGSCTTVVGCSALRATTGCAHRCGCGESRFCEGSTPRFTTRRIARRWTPCGNRRRCGGRYFGVFDELVLRDKETFRFSGRVRRPPTDPTNAMLSLFYTVLAFDCASALEAWDSILSSASCMRISPAGARSRWI